MIEIIQPKIRGRMTGLTAHCRPPSVAAFEQLRALLRNNQHFGGASKQLDRIEHTLKAVHGVRLPLPRHLAQNGNMTLGLIWPGLSMLISNEVIMWRYGKRGEPRSVTNAASEGVPTELLAALAQVARFEAH